VVDWPPESFAEQFALFGDHGIMVSPHSAGLTNTMFMAHGSAVIEMFPYHMHHALYPSIAFQSGAKSIPIHAVNGSIIFRRDPVSGCASVRAWGGGGVVLICSNSWRSSAARGRHW
jgi:hypothetical protein